MEETQKPNKQGQPRDPRQAYGRPGDPETNTRPPGNGDRDNRETERSEERLLTVLGR